MLEHLLIIIKNVSHLWFRYSRYIYLWCVVVLRLVITKTISEAVSPLLSPYDVQIGGKALRLSLHQLQVFSGRQGGETNNYGTVHSFWIALALLQEAPSLHLLTLGGWPEMERLLPKVRAGKTLVQLSYWWSRPTSRPIRTLPYCTLFFWHRAIYT